MNKEIYKYLLHTYGKRFGFWGGVIGEAIRSLMVRVWVVIVMARIAANLAEHHLTAAKHDVAIFLVVYVIGSAVGTVGDLIAIHAEDYEYEKLMVNYSAKLTGKDMSFYRDSQSGYLVSLFRQYLDSTMLLVRLIRGDVVRAAIGLAMPAVVLGVLNWKLGLVAGAVVVVQVVYITWSSARANKWRELSHEIYRKVTAEVSDAITNITAFKSSGAEREAQARIAKLAREETLTFWERRKLTATLDLPRDILTAVGITIALYVILSTQSGNGTSVGLIVLTLTYMFQIVRTVSDLPNLMTSHDDLITKLYPTLSYLGSSHESISDPVKPKKLRVTEGEISINNVNFGYPSQARNGNQVHVFKDLSLHIKGSEQVGIVGLSGAGKSTLASLLMRFDDIDDGGITIDGIDIRAVRQKELRRQIAYVPQEPLLFHRTIRENIAYFNSRASEQAITRAAKAAHAHEFITGLPDGYDSMVGERGVKLSGGQKQRVVIARAILKNAPIMLFDEATSALDSESEKIIQQALPQILGKRTAIVIAHRLSTIASLDRILVMDHGQIIEQGTHEELLKIDGRYAALWKKQIMSSRTSAPTN
jgi:ATP-binding cassette, subfamily B, bacterial